MSKIDLVCHLYPGWSPIIRPAEATRDWMTATSDQFAYRCLPLNIANAHGWEVLAPCDFEAIWHGGNNKSDIEIRLAPETAKSEAPVSHFGHAVLTFHIQGIFRTSPGWNLFVTGSPNIERDGIVPLSGVIETDWSPYTFTMNWRFVRKDHWISFKKGDPICFFFPVQRNLLENISPHFEPMTDDLLIQYKAWSASRDEFQKEMKKPPLKPRSKSDTWQKHYYRGVDMNDNAGVVDHKSRLRLAPFTETKLLTPAPKTLEMRGDVKTIGNTLRAIINGLGDGVANEILAVGLKELGLKEADALNVINIITK